MVAYWPKVTTIMAAVRGAVFVHVAHNEDGHPIGGVESAVPWVAYAANRAALCRRCDTIEEQPDPPTSRGLNGNGEPLLAPGTTPHALFLLTWLNRFAKAHAKCEEKQD